MGKSKLVIFITVLYLCGSLFGGAFPFAEEERSFSLQRCPEDSFHELIISVEEEQCITNRAHETSNEEMVDLTQLFLDQGLRVIDITSLPNLKGYRGKVLLTQDLNNHRCLHEFEQLLSGKLAGKGYTLRYIEPNYPLSQENRFMEEQALNDAIHFHPEQERHYSMIELEKAWSITEGSDDIRIAVLDSGIDHNHKSLKEYVDRSLGRNFTSFGPEEETSDQNGHGTHVAGTIASSNSVNGVMRKATLIPVKVLDRYGNGSYYQAQKGIYHSVAMGADIINMSIGGELYSQAYEEACQYAEEMGVIIVAASGNRGSSRLKYPAGFQSTLSVGAVDLEGRRASFSNYGEHLDIMGPGVAIYSTLPNNRYGYFDGTSMAVPHVTGVIGLLLSENPDLSPQEIREILYTSASRPEDGESLHYGSGIVNAYRALTIQRDHREKQEEQKDMIVRIAGENRYETAVRILMSLEEQPESLILVRGDSINGVPQVVDGLTASGLAGARNTGILLVKKDHIPDVTWEGIVTSNPNNIILIGGEEAISIKVEEELKNTGMNVERISGGTRFSTAAEVALSMGSAKEDTAIIVNGFSEADSLLAGPMAYKGYPVLMVNNAKNSIPYDTLNAIDVLGIKNLVIVGGDEVVSKDLENQLKNIRGIAGIERFAGRSRVETSLVFSQSQTFHGEENVSLINGWRYVDGIAASTLRHPVVYLNQRHGLTFETERFLGSRKRITVIGGTHSISEELIDTLVDVIIHEKH